jgi:hypothetical protein
MSKRVNNRSGRKFRHRSVNLSHCGRRQVETDINDKIMELRKSGITITAQVFNRVKRFFTPQKRATA